MTDAPVPNVTLNNGVEMPILGFGVYQNEEGVDRLIDAFS